MKIFIDLGAFIGDTLKTALSRFKKFDRFYVFEPLSKNFEELKKEFGRKDNIILINAAADIETGKNKLYLGREWGDLGGSLCVNKTTCFKNKFELVETLDFSKFIINNLRLDDKIIIKIDIEGKEYDLLEKMIRDDSIKYINEIYCEWHYDRIGMDFKIHQDYIRQLRKRGFNLTGNNRLDEFVNVANISRIRLQLKRYKFYYGNQYKTYLKNKFPQIANLWHKQFLRR